MIYPSGDRQEPHPRHSVAITTSLCRNVLKVDLEVVNNPHSLNNVPSASRSDVIRKHRHL